MLKDKVFISFLGCIKKLFVGFTFGLSNVKAAYIEAPVNRWLHADAAFRIEQHIKIFLYVATRGRQ